MEDPKEDNDPGFEIAQMFGRGEIGANTAARLMMLQFCRESGMSEQALEVLEEELKRAGEE